MPAPSIRAGASISAAAGCWLTAAAVVALASPGRAGLSRPPSWSIPSVASVRAKAEHWPAGTVSPPVDPAAAAAARAAWDQVVDGQGDLLDAVVTTIALREPRAAGIVAAVDRGTAPDVAWLDDPSSDAFVADAIRLWWGRELVRQERFDEALPFLARLEPDDSVDPASILFLRAACEHWLLRVDDAIESLDRLLEREEEIPVRYARVARLLRVDIAALEAESLDHIARRMRDATRRLDHGRAGSSTVDVQKGVVASLDKLIEKLEEQQRQQEQGGGGAGGGSGSGQGGSGSPMDDSRIARGRGPGDVRKRELIPGESWGNLPPHDRERALQQIGREFPPHYREAIEQYFKRLAGGGEER